jgi:hypothetical protein
LDLTKLAITSEDREEYVKEYSKFGALRAGFACQLYLLFELYLMRFLFSLSDIMNDLPGGT